jgi:hypothetical protein
LFIFKRTALEQVLQRAFIHKGKKRVRRSKLYYLRDLDPLICKVSWAHIRVSQTGLLASKLLYTFCLSKLLSSPISKRHETKELVIPGAGSICGDRITEKALVWRRLN